MSEILVHPFPPLYDEYSKVLILGSFPSVVSRQRNFYYANPQNRFWRVMRELFGDYDDPERLCHENHIALWDVIASCVIDGSSDASIREAKVNDIAKLVEKTRIRAVFTTGSKASRLYEKYVACELPHYSLPSTSGANARMRMDELVERYAVIRKVICEKD